MRRHVSVDIFMGGEHRSVYVNMVRGKRSGMQNHERGDGARQAPRTCMAPVWKDVFITGSNSILIGIYDNIMQLCALMRRAHVVPTINA